MLPSSPQKLSACDFAALSATVARGGLIEFACGGVIDFPYAISILPKHVVTIDASGVEMIFDGQHETRLFVEKVGT